MWDIPSKTQIKKHIEHGYVDKPLFKKINKCELSVFLFLFYLKNKKISFVLFLSLNFFSFNFF